MTKETKQLEDLYTDDSLINESEISTSIHPIVVIHRESKKILIKSDEYSNTQKIVAYALAKKLLHNKDKEYIEGVTVSEIIRELGFKRGTADGEMGKLRKLGIFILIDKEIGYEIPMYKITEVLAIINK